MSWQNLLEWKKGDIIKFEFINTVQPQFGGSILTVEVIEISNNGEEVWGDVKVIKKDRGKAKSDLWDNIYGDVGFIYNFIVYENKFHVGNRLVVGEDQALEGIGYKFLGMDGGGKRKRRNKKSKKKIARKSKIGRKIKKSTIRK